MPGEYAVPQYPVCIRPASLPAFLRGHRFSSSLVAATATTATASILHARRALARASTHKRGVYAPSWRCCRLSRSWRSPTRTGARRRNAARHPLLGGRSLLLHAARRRRVASSGSRTCRRGPAAAPPLSPPPSCSRANTPIRVGRKVSLPSCQAAAARAPRVVRQPSVFAHRRVVVKSLASIVENFAWLPVGAASTKPAVARSRRFKHKQSGNSRLGVVGL